MILLKTTYATTIMIFNERKKENITTKVNGITVDTAKLFYNYLDYLNMQYSHYIILTGCKN